MTEGFHLYYFKVFLCLTMRAVCPVQLKPSFQFSSGHSGLDQFSSIQFNSVCFTWKWLTPLTAGSHLLFISCAPTGLKLHHQPSPTGRQRSDVSVCVCVCVAERKTSKTQVCVNVITLSFSLLV